jgi:ABC-type bacteriocin/lantibiotic exporter with double-glycine peptidase domain
MAAPVYSNHDKANPVQKLFKLLGNFKSEIKEIYLFALLNSLVSLSLPLGLQAIIQYLITGQPSSSLYLIMVVIVLATILNGWMNIHQLNISEHVRQMLFVRGAFDFVHRIPRLDLQRLVRGYVPEMMNRFFDVVAIQSSLQKALMDFSTAFFQMIFGLLLLSFYHPIFIALTLILLLLFYFVIILLGKKALYYSIKESGHKYKVVFWLEEMARLSTTIRLLPTLEPGIRKMDAEVDAYLEDRNAHYRILKIQYWGLVLMKLLVIGSLMALGVILLQKQQINLAQFVAAEIVVLLVISSIEKIIFQMDAIYDLITSVTKVAHVADLPLKEASSVSPEQRSDIPDNGPLSLTLQQLSFKYDDSTQWKFQDLNLQVHAGQKICISGRGGSGKNTLLKLMTGIYSASQGQVLIDQKPMEWIDSMTLNKRLGHCLHSEGVFEDTLYDNIDLGRGCTADQIMQACQQVGLEPYLAHLEDGIFTRLQSEGSPLSATAAKRVVLARSVVHQPGLMIYEDVFTALTLDEKAELYNTLTGLPWTLVAFSNDPLLQQACDLRYELSNRQITKLP